MRLKAVESIAAAYRFTTVLSKPRAAEYGIPVVMSWRQFLDRLYVMQNLSVSPQPNSEHAQTITRPELLSTLTF